MAKPKSPPDMGLSDSKKRYWLRLLRGSNSIWNDAAASLPVRRELADTLEHHFFFPKPGGRPLTLHGRMNRGLHAIQYQRLVEAELAAMREQGKLPRDARTRAKRAVAESLGITVEALEKRMTP